MPRRDVQPFVHRAADFLKMTAAKPIQIVGGGLAGLTLGIALRKRGIPVAIFEAGNYPRHRVCGEFISGRGQDSLARLGLRELLDRAGAVNAATATFFSDAGSTLARALPARAVCLSRFTLDAALAGRFCESGGELLAGRRFAETFGDASSAPRAGARRRRKTIRAGSASRFTRATSGSRRIWKCTSRRRVTSACAASRAAR